MYQPFLSRSTYYILFSLLFVVYVIGLFIPLMDNDSAHHANIALRMYLTGDWVSLVDHGKDYLDKPHLHFWLAAASYHLFGVTTFAYKIPSFLFTVLGTYSTFRLGKSLYNHEVGKLAALITASAFAYVLANNDVRMDAILTASIVFATWQLADWIKNKRLVNALGAALGLALGFCTKGHIAVVVPGVSALCYILYLKDWKAFYHWHLLLLIAAFFVAISPVVYCYYLQYDLHPEKVIRGKGGRSGVEFILWGQSIERFEGESFGAEAKNDYLFFFHSFLWAFAPWSILSFIAFFNRLKYVASRKEEWLTTGTFAVILVLISVSGFKLPHYLNILFPIAGVFTASYLLQHIENKILLKRVLLLQGIVCILILIGAGILNVWAFPPQSTVMLIGFLIILGVCILLLRRAKSKIQQLITASVVTSILIFYLLNANFYPQLLTYQVGNEIAFDTVGKVDAKQVYFWPGIYSSSYNFYTAELRKEYRDSLKNKTPLWLFTDANHLPEFKEKGLTILESYEHVDHEITRLSLKFINPARRKEVVGKGLLVRVR
ncbi:MAG TPA: glycosyltransferase family 39 protein [Chitinophagaceae bacterium]|nr:glycosyltransferase family 39 protein [Chitinophagaceae bacterium]